MVGPGREYWATILTSSWGSEIPRKFKSLSLSSVPAVSKLTGPHLNIRSSSVW